MSVNRPDTSNWSDLFAWRKAVNSTRGPSSGTTKAVLQSLALYFDTDGHGARPAVDTLACSAGFCRRAVGIHLVKAGQAGWITRRPWSNGRGFKGWVYSIAFPDGADPRDPARPRAAIRILPRKGHDAPRRAVKPQCGQVRSGRTEAKDLTRPAMHSGAHDGEKKKKEEPGGRRCPSGDAPIETKASPTEGKGVAVAPPPQGPPRDLLRAVVAARLTERLSCSLVERYGPVRSSANWKRAVSRELAADSDGLHREAVRLGLAPPGSQAGEEQRVEGGGVREQPSSAAGGSRPPSSWDEHQAHRAQQVEAWAKVDPEVRRRQAGPNEVMAGLAAQGASFALEHLAELHGWPGGAR